MRVSDWIRQALGLVGVEQLKETESKILDELVVVQAQTDKLSKQPELDVWDQVKKLAPLAAPSLTLITAIAYFIGRLGSQSYYGRLGLLGQISFSFEDYLFATAQEFFTLVSFGLVVPICDLILTLIFVRFFQSRPRLLIRAMMLGSLLSFIAIFIGIGARLNWWSIPIADSILLGSGILGELILIVMVRASQEQTTNCLLYTSPSPRDRQRSRMPSSA